MVEVIYGADNCAELVWQEIAAKRAVVGRVTGWKKGIVHRLIDKYQKYDEEQRRGRLRRSTLFSLGWRSILSPSMIALCRHARSTGMMISVKDKVSTLEIKFEVPS